MEAAVLIAFTLLACGILAVLLVPREVAYTEAPVIAAPVAEIYDHIRFQARLMQWSSWPAETGSDCAIEGPQDGAVGERTVFFTKAGKRFGYQEVTALEPGRRVDLALTTLAGPPQRPLIAFELELLEPARTRVVLHFRNTIARPFNVLLRVFGVMRWTRAMHRKDLDGLRRYAEPPRQTYAGTPVPEATEPAPAWSPAVDPYPHAFEGPLRRHGVGNGLRVLWYVVLLLPSTMEATLPFMRFPRLRVEGEVADIPVSGAWMPAGDGRRYFIVSAAVRKMAEVSVGDVVPMRFAVADQEKVEVHPALLDALQRQPDALAVWEGLTPGRRRGLAHSVAAARTEATRARRVVAVLDAMLDRSARA